MKVLIGIESTSFWRQTDAILVETTSIDPLLLTGLWIRTELTFIMVSLSNWLMYLQLSIDKLQLLYTGHSRDVKFISWLTTARWSPVGLRPMARQKRITCMTGRAKMKSITLGMESTNTSQNNIPLQVFFSAHFSSESLTRHCATSVGNSFEEGPSSSPLLWV